MPFLDISIENLITIKNLVFFDYREFSGTIPKNHESHNFWEMVYVLEGKLCEIAEDEKYILNKGDILFHHPNKPHSTVSVDDGEVKVCFISFVCNSKAMDFFRNYKTTVSDTAMSLLNMVIQEGRNTFEIMRYTKSAKLVQRGDAPIGGSQMYKLYLEALLINMLRERCSEQSSKIFANKQELFEHLCNDICEYLAENVYNNVTLDSICSKFNYGKSLICAKFKEQYGESVMNYYIRLKINEACRLMEKNHSITYISTALNFTDRYYFSKVFKKIVGMCPKEYQANKLSQIP